MAWPTLSRAAARKACRRGLDAEELIQEAALQILLQKHLYDPARGPVDVWVKLHLQGAAFRLASRRRRERELAVRSLSDEAEDRRTLAEGVASGDRPPEDLAADKLSFEHLRAALEKLPAREAAVLARVYGLDGCGGASLAVASREFGVSAERIRQLGKRAISRLRRTMAVGELVVGGGQMCP